MASALSSDSKFPLERVTETQLKGLCRVLWSWELCEDCENSKSCATEGCPAQRLRRLGRFFEHYKDLTAAYERDDEGPPVLGKHEDLFEIIRQLKANPDASRRQLRDKLFPTNNNVVGDDGPGMRRFSAADQERAINLAVRVMAAVNCSAQHGRSTLLEHGANQVAWRADVAFSQFVIDAFPTTDHPNLNGDDVESALDVKAAITAKKLKKQLGLKFEATDDLRSHLRFDQKRNTLQIYHHTAVLKEHLRLTMPEPRNRSVSDSIKLGALPRALALEALDSIQRILFPLSDTKSHALLASLVSTASFDPDCLRFEAASIRYLDEKHIPYHYFGARLADLYEEVQHPKPRGWQKWLERKSGARYVMLATLGGVVVAVLLGLFGLGIAVFQAWVGYQAWQFPVSH